MDTEEEYYDVVISGMSGKFPASDDVDILKKNLLEKQLLVNDEDCRWNKDKWKVPAAIGKISVLKKFDDTFFGIYSGVASMMDPLTRVSIERAYEAVMDAGISPKFLRGSNTAVYIASCISDSEAVGCDEKLTSKFWLLAHVRALLANRISYVLNLHGPSWTIDSNWIGGMECLTRAVDDIRKGRVENALVGVTNVITFPDLSQHWLKLGKLSPDGSCYPFEETANGYGRSEAVVLFFLQRAKEAKRVYATITHSDATFCGEDASTLLKPKQEALYHFLKQFYSTCNVCPRDIGYLEADGSADKYLDTIELNTIEKILCNDQRDQPLLVGSIKSNLGHAEGASPFVSVTKALITLDGEVIPPNISFTKPNKQISAFKSNKIEIVTKPVTFPEGKSVAVNTIGLCSSVGHVVLKQNPKRRKQGIQTLPIPRLVLLSARHEPGLLDIVEKLESAPPNEEHFSLINEVFKENMTGHFYRGFTILGSTEKKIHFTLETGSIPKRPVWFVFAGMGSQWPGMGADLMKLPIFAESMKELNTYLAPLGVDIYDVITNFDPTVIKKIVHSFVGIAAIQIGLVDVLFAAGIKPDGIFGHSLGENGCAYADGCFNKYQTIMAAYFRGKASEKIPLAKGIMAAVGLSYDKLPPLPDNVQVACHNSFDNTTISGPAEDVEEYIKILRRQNIIVRIVNSNNVAYHSRQVEPLAPYVLENIRKVVPNPKKRSSKWISTSVPESEWNSLLAQTSSAEYHVNNFLGTVYFAEACMKVPEEAAVIEISPHGLFQGILKRTVPDTCFVIPLGKRETGSPLNFLLSSIGKLHVVGIPVDANAIYPPVEYPVSRGTPSLASLATWNHETDWELNTYYDEATIKPLTISLRERKWRFLCGYKINEKVIMPFGLLLIETLKAYSTNDPILVFENVNIPRHIEVSANETTNVYIQVQLGSGNFEITRDNEVIMNGMLRYSQENMNPCDIANYDDNEEHDCIIFTASEIADTFKQYSMEFSDNISNIHRIVFTDEGLEASIIWKDNLSYFINSIAHVKMFYDLCVFEKGPLLPSEFLKLSIEVEKYNTMQEGTKVNIFYDRKTDIFSGSGFELVGFKSVYEPPTSQEHDLSLQNLQFVSHENPKLETMENFLGICGQIVGENYYFPTKTEDVDQSSKVTVLMFNDVSKVMDLKVAALSIFTALSQELLETQIEFDFVNPDDIKNLRKSGNKYKRYFLICNDTETMAEELTVIGNHVGDIFICSFSKTTVELSDTFVKILHTKLHGHHLTLWKKKIPFYGKILKAKPEINEHWIDEVEDELYSIQQQSLVVIQWYSKFVIDILDIVNQINGIESRHSFRYLLIMDENKSDSASDMIYMEQLDKGLVMNVFKDGTWGSIRTLEMKYKTPFTGIDSLLLKCQQVPNVNLEFISIHESLKNTEPEEKGRYFEYSGVDNQGSRLMGVANSEGKNAELQILFQWPIPKTWSLEDAVTVPLAYIKAYYAIVIEGRIRTGSSVLIHSGYTILGEASIAVALSLNCNVFTSADSLEEAKYIITRFSNSSRLSILNSNLSQIDIEILKLTKGQGVDAAINPTTEQQLQQSIRCIKIYGTILYLCDYDINKTERIGMEVFLKSVKMCSVSNLRALNFEDNTKQEIANFITEAMKKNSIKPIKRCVIKSIDENFTNNVSRVDNKTCKTVIMQNFNSNNHNKSFMCDPQKSYMIVGDKNEIWFRTISWLLQHGAKKLVFIEPEPEENKVNQNERKFSTFIQNYSDVSLMHLSETNLKNENDCSDIIQTVNKYAKLDVVFCISTNSDKTRILDLALRKWALNLRQFVCLQCDAAKVCESRRLCSLPALNLLWDRSISNTSILVENIKQILNNLMRLNSSFLSITNVSDSVSRYNNLMLNRVEQFLPNGCETELFLESFSEHSAFRKEVSKCAEFSTRTQLFPIFMLPGLHSSRLKKLIRKLMYPVFCAHTPPVYCSVEQTARSLIEPMKNIQPNGPYTIIGESWSGTVAIELTTLLENEGHKVQLILLEGMPNDMESKLASIGPFGSHDFIEKIYESCLNHEKTPNGNPSAFPKDKVSKSERRYLELLQRRLRNSLQYNPKHIRVRNKVIAIKMKDTSILNSYITFEELYGQELDLRIIEKDSYDDLINDDETATIINDNVLFKW